MPFPPTAPPRSQDELLELLLQNFTSLSTQFQGGARYLIDHPQEVPILSMRKIATDAGVQPTTLVRLSQFMGFDGWQSLRALFVEALHGAPQTYARRAKTVMAQTGSQRMLAEMMATQHRNLEQIENNNAETIAQATNLLSAAPHVYIAGFRACHSIAFSFHYLYCLFRTSAALIRGDAGMLELELRALAPQDAVVLISFAPYSQEIIRVADAARACGCRLIAITDSNVAPIAIDADCTLLIPVDSPSFFPSISAGMTLVEALVEQLLARQGPAALKQLEQTERQLHQSGAYAPAGSYQRPVK